MNRLPSRITIELDDHASELLRGYMTGSLEVVETIQRGHDPRDMVSAAICFLLEEADEHGWCSSDEAVTQAMVRRLQLEGAAGCAVPPLPVAVVLDKMAARLLARAVHELKDDPRDVVNGSLICMLQSWLDDLSEGAGECVKRAKARRLKSSGKKEAA